jgi:hypothetical protein
VAGNALLNFNRVVFVARAASVIIINFILMDKHIISSVPRLDKKWDVKADLQAASALAGELGYGAQIQTNLPAGASQPARPNVPALIEAEPDHFVAA